MPNQYLPVLIYAALVIAFPAVTLIAAKPHSPNVHERRRKIEALRNAGSA